jgi:hypothetical protein
MHIFGHIETLSCQIKPLGLLHRELPMQIKPNGAQFMIVATRDILGTDYTPTVHHGMILKCNSEPKFIKWGTMHEKSI